MDPVRGQWDAGRGPVRPGPPGGIQQVGSTEQQKQQAGGSGVSGLFLFLFQPEQESEQILKGSQMLSATESLSHVVSVTVVGVYRPWEM